MLKSSNLNSIIDAVAAEQAASSESSSPRPSTLDLAGFSNNLSNNRTVIAAEAEAAPTTNDTPTANTNASPSPSLASQQLATGMLQIFEPPLVRARGQLKELIGKQNKIYIDLSAEKYKLDNPEMAKMHEMMNNVKIYREKLIKIKKQMQSIYQRTKVLKKRAANIQTCKQKELQRKLQKLQQEESLIAKQQQ